MSAALSRTDWLDAGLRLIGEHGPSSLRIDVLCRELGVTKGSFYHHFGGQPAYVTALLAHWKSSYTQQLIDAVADIGDARQRSERLSELALGKDMKPEVALRAWAMSDAEVAATVQAVDAQRIQYLIDLAQRMGLTPERARLTAQMAYAQLVGIQHLPALITPADAALMDQTLAAALLTGGEAGA